MERRKGESNFRVKIARRHERILVNETRCGHLVANKMALKEVDKAYGLEPSVHRALL